MLTAEQRNMILAAICVGILVAVAFFAATAGTAYSLRHSPPSVTDAAQNQPGTNGANADKASSVVSEMGTQNSQSPEDDQAREGEEKAKLDRRLVDLTGNLADYTARLFYATAALVLATLVLGILGYFQGRDLRESAKIARDEFDATHRPKIVIQHVTLSDKGGRGSEHGRIDFMVVNAGEAKATIKRFSAFGYGQFSDAAFMPAFRETVPHKPKDFALAPGARCLICADCQSYEFEWDRFVIGDGRFFAVGRVEYIGNDGIERVSGFCREYLKSTGMWERVNNSEYEYAY